MFEFTCPKCRKKVTLTAAPTGKVSPCPGCGQRLRVVPEVAEEGVSLAESAAAPPRRFGGPLLAVLCTAGGILAAAVILLAWAFLGRGPATDTKVAENEPGPAGVGQPLRPAARNDAPRPADTNPAARSEAIPPAEQASPAATAEPPKATRSSPAPVRNESPAGQPPQATFPQRTDPTPSVPARPPLGGAPPDRTAPKETPRPAPSAPPRRAQILTTTPKPADPNLLAEGPEHIVVGYTRGGQDLEEKGTLCVLKTTGVWYRDEATGKLVKSEARGGFVKWVETADKKYRWELDEGKGLFTGKAKPAEGFDLQPLPLSRDDEGRYLLFSLEGLQERIEDALDQKDARLMRACRQQADALAAYCRDNRFDASLVRLCEAVGPYLDGQTRLWEERRQAVADARRQMSDLQRREAEARSRQQAHQLLGFAQALFGAIPQTVGYGRDSDTGQVIEYQTTDDEAVASGLGEMMKANVRYAAERAQIETAKTAFTKATAEKFLSLQTRYADNRKERARSLRAVGARDFGLSATDAQERQEQLAQACRDSKDYLALVQVLEDQVRQDRGGGQRDNPFLLVEICQLKALVPRPDAKKKAEEAFALARECVASARLVPAPAVYDFDRAHVLRQAARLALTASTLEIGGQSWAGAYNPKARYAVRLLGQLGPLAAFDADGEVREMRAWALLQGGDSAAALEQALEVQELRQQAPFFGFHLAQLYGARNGPGDAKEAMKCLDHAVRQAHFCGIAELWKCPDLLSVRTQERQAFRDLTAFVPAFSTEMGGRTLFGPARAGAGLSITNKSAYAWTNATVKVQVVVVDGNRARAQTLTLPDTWSRIEPQQTVTAADAFKGLGQVRFRVTGVAVECDQNRR